MKTKKISEIKLFHVELRCIQVCYFWTFNKNSLKCIFMIFISKCIIKMLWTKYIKAVYYLRWNRILLIPNTWTKHFIFRHIYCHVSKFYIFIILQIYVLGHKPYQVENSNGRTFFPFYSFRNYLCDEVYRFSINF